MNNNKRINILRCWIRLSLFLRNPYADSIYADSASMQVRIALLLMEYGISITSIGQRISIFNMTIIRLRITSKKLSNKDLYIKTYTNINNKKCILLNNFHLIEEQEIKLDTRCIKSFMLILCIYSKSNIQIHYLLNNSWLESLQG